MKKLRGILAAAVAMSMVFTTVNVSAEEKKKDEKITLNIMHFHTQESNSTSIEAEAYNALSEKFMEEHPEVEWNVTTLQEADYQTKIMALAAANELPDIFFTKGSWIQNFYDNNLMYDLTDDIDPSIYREGILQAVTRNDRIYGLPIMFTVTSLVYYNQTMWEEIGYDSFPTTWEDMEKANELFKEKGITMIAMGNKDKWPIESCVMSTLGDRFTGTDWTRSILNKDGKAKFTDSEFVDMLTTVQNMTDMFNPDFNALTNEQAESLYCAGKAATEIQGAWGIPFLTANGDPDVLENTHLALLPEVENEKGEANASSSSAAWSQSISSKLSGKALEIAIEYVKATTGKEFCEYMMKKQGYLGQCIVDVEPEVDLNNLQKEWLDFSKTLTLVPIYDGEMDGAIIDVMNSKVQEMMNGGTTPEDVAKAIQEEQEKE